MYTIDVQVSERMENRLPASLDLSAVEHAARTTLESTSAPDDAELTILLSDDQQLHDLNLKFLGIDAPTDVLSFPADYIDPDTTANYLGDILISLQMAQAQAEAGGHPLMAEVQLLVVHGVLHLLGYDHAEEADKAEMWALQLKVLQNLGLPLSPP